MAITINGSGTITGVSTGGLPDGIVDADMLAGNAVTSAKILDGTIANGDVNDLAASKLTGALPAISGASLTNIPEAITEADIWSLSSSFSGNANPIVNWVRMTTTLGSPAIWTKKGTGMSYSSGIWTFPSTGIWSIYLMVMSTSINSATWSRFLQINCSSNGGTNWQGMAYCQGHHPNLHSTATTISQSPAECLFNVTNTSNCKVKISTNDDNAGSITTSADQDRLATAVKFIRLGASV